VVVVGEDEDDGKGDGIPKLFELGLCSRLFVVVVEWDSAVELPREIIGGSQGMRPSAKPRSPSRLLLRLLLKVVLSSLEVAAPLSVAVTLTFRGGDSNPNNLLTGRLCSRGGEGLVPGSPLTFSELIDFPDTLVDSRSGPTSPALEDVTIAFAFGSTPPFPCVSLRKLEIPKLNDPLPLGTVGFDF